MKLVIRRKDIKKILRHAVEVFPIECCGVLAGRKLKTEYIVEKVYPAKNVLESSYEYRMDPEEQLRIFEDAEASGLEVIGFYHSHPLTEAYWSSIDEEKSRLWPGYVFLVVSPKKRSFTAYLRKENETVEIDIEIR